MAENLFPIKEPLASKLRPEKFNEVLGQDKLTNLLTNIKSPISIIFYGPPGSGKTTIAKILSKSWNLPFHHLSAISIGVGEIKSLIKDSEKQGSIILFLDEIHRFSTSQQDALLDAVETGKIYLIGATTENPAFRINRPLLSRTQIYKLSPLSAKELLIILEKGLNEVLPGKVLDENSKNLLINSSNGDARKLLGIIESMSVLEKSNINITYEMLETYLESQVSVYDKNKENHYDTISAFIKSIRGSDPDAALLYLASMIEGGEDPIFIMRRLVILASEDVGNASVQALTLAVSGLDAIEKIGMPEGRIILSQVTTFLASCPKSNASYTALENASKFIKELGKSFHIPLKLRNSVTFLQKKEGYGKDYKYPHDYPEHFINENYFPDEIKENPPQFYFPSMNGTDKTLKERLKSLWEKTGKKKYD